jgi:hypothetical protein
MHNMRVWDKHLEEIDLTRHMDGTPIISVILQPDYVNIGQALKTIKTSDMLENIMENEK